jgi:hypothetical protein
MPPVGPMRPRPRISVLSVENPDRFSGIFLWDWS